MLSGDTFISLIAVKSNGMMTLTFATMLEPKNDASPSPFSRYSAKYSGTFRIRILFGCTSFCCGSGLLRMNGARRACRAAPSPVSHVALAPDMQRHNMRYTLYVIGDIASHKEPLKDVPSLVNLGMSDSLPNSSLKRPLLLYACFSWRQAR